MELGFNLTIVFFLIRKYFHKAICQSGTATMEWVVQGNPAEKTSKLAQLTGCKEASSKEILGMDLLILLHITLVFNSKSDFTLVCRCITIRFVAHLMDVSASDLYDQLYAVLSLDDKRRGLPMAFKPVVEIDTVNLRIRRSEQRRFLLFFISARSDFDQIPNENHE